MKKENNKKCFCVFDDHPNTSIDLSGVCYALTIHNMYVTVESDDEDYEGDSYE